jgi:hypothetical protein
MQCKRLKVKLSLYQVCETSNLPHFLDTRPADGGEVVRLPGSKLKVNRLFGGAEGVDTEIFKIQAKQNDYKDNTIPSSVIVNSHTGRNCVIFLILLV